MMKSLALSIKPLFILSVLILSACGGGGDGGSASVNLAPTITSANFQVEQDSDLTATISATDPEGDTVTFSQTSEPDNGEMVSFAANGEFTYRPNAGFIGSDSFTVSISDGTNQVSATITVNIIEVAPTNQAPTVTSANFELDQNTSLTATLTATDPEGDTVTFTVSGEPTNGQLVSFDSNGAFTYTPNGGFTGSDSFNIFASDGTNQVDATITLNVLAVNPVNEAPTITAANFDGVQDTELSETITASDPEGDTVTFTQTSEPSSGSMMAFAANGNFTYRPNAGFVGTDSFTITASDGENEITATISITIFEEEPTNEPPTITSGNFEGNQDTDLSGIITASDPEGDTVTFTQTSEPSSGSMMAFSANGDFTYRPNSGFVGTDSFTITASDGVDEVAATITLNVLEVIPPNEAPSFTSASTANVDENTSGVVYTAISNDPDGDSLTFSIDSGDDQNLFRLDAASGDLSFITLADFEAPSDANADNVYEVTLTVEDDNGGSDQLALALTVEDVTQLSFQVSYPTPNANLGGDVEFTSVTGVLEDLEDGEVLESDIDFINVNGLSANIELPTPQDAVARWRTQLPLSSIPGGVLNIESLDSSSNSQQFIQRLLSRPSFSDPVEFALDIANNRALVIDSGLDALISVDLDSGERTIISNEDIGGGVNLGRPEDVVLDSTNNRVLLVDDTLDALIAIDLNNGDRTIISDDNTGSGTNFNLIVAIELDSANNRALVLDINLDALMAVDLSNGNRQILSDDNIGTGIGMAAPRSIVLDSDNNRALVVDSSIDALIAIDLATGNRTILSDVNTGTGTNMLGARGVALDTANNRVLVIDIGLRAVVEIDLASGNRTILSDDNTGDGVSFVGSQAIALDSVNNRALAVDFSYDALLTIDLASGNRSILSDASSGTGIDLIEPDHLELDSANNRVLVVETSFPSALFAIDLGSGNRSVISDVNIGTGVSLGNPQGFVIDEENNRVLLLDASPIAVLAIDLESGDRSIISDTNTGSGVELEFPEDIVLDSTNNRALVIDSRLDALIAIDLDNGNRSIISDANTGAGSNMVFPASLALDRANNRVLAVDISLDAVLAIDLASGDRSIISDDNIGIGVELGSPNAIKLDNTNNLAVVVDGALRALFSIDLISGDRTIISDDNTGTGADLGFPRGLALDRDNNRAFVSSSTSSIVVIDLVTGERAVSSKSSLINLD